MAAMAIGSQDLKSAARPGTAGFWSDCVRQPSYPPCGVPKSLLATDGVPGLLTAGIRVAKVGA
jgi:hypothetical protein